MPSVSEGGLFLSAALLWAEASGSLDSSEGRSLNLPAPTPPAPPAAPASPTHSRGLGLGFPLGVCDSATGNHLYRVRANEAARLTKPRHKTRASGAL